MYKKLRNMSCNQCFFHCYTYSRNECCGSESIQKRRRKLGLVIPGQCRARTKSRLHYKILDRERNDLKIKYSHFDIEQELS